ncbi:MAG: 2-dehydro-3-deoxygalactonokinase [Pseudomonadota bacterium]
MAAPDTHAAWIAVDWGTTNLRVWAMSADDEILDHARSEDGMARLQPAEFEGALLRLVESWLGSDPVSVIACGMVGARQGWIEAPYRAVPCTPLESGFATPAVRNPYLRVRVIPGLKQEDPPDVMRGEETQIAGFLHENSGFDGVLCLPGTHTKWAHVSAGKVVGFQTFMTGENFALLAERSVLRHSIDRESWDAQAFAEAVGDLLSRPERLGAKLFDIRAEELLHGQRGGGATATLSGALLGVELAAARSYWRDRRVALVGATPLVDFYAKALELQGIATEVVDGDRKTLTGLIAARHLIPETAP